MINRRWQRDNDQGAGFVGYFVALRGTEPQVAELLATAEQWLAQRGADRVIAPFNGAAMRGLGTLTGAFDESPMFPFPWQPPHHPALLEANGYRPSYPFWIFDIDCSSERYRDSRPGERAVHGAPVDKKRWKPEMETMRTVFNDTFCRAGSWTTV